MAKGGDGFYLAFHGHEVGELSLSFVVEKHGPDTSFKMTQMEPPALDQCHTPSDDVKFIRGLRKYWWTTFTNYLSCTS